MHEGGGCGGEEVDAMQAERAWFGLFTTLALRGNRQNVTSAAFPVPHLHSALILALAWLDLKAGLTIHTTAKQTDIFFKDSG